MMLKDHELRLKRAKIALDGLSIGDAFGDQLPARLPDTARYVANRELPPVPWRWTDDTNMALSVYANLKDYGQINQEELAQSFAYRYDISRGYGPAAHRILRRIREGGEPWQTVAYSLTLRTGDLKMR
jgi:ADP-ribosylglycohydrolase